MGQQGGQQAGGVGVGQGVEADGGPARAPAGPALQQLRPGGGQDQDGRRAGVPVAEALDEVEQGVVGPVQVLQGQDQRPGRGQAVQEAPPGGELLLAVGGGGRPGAPRAAAADADQAAQVTGDPGGGDRLGHRARGRDQPPPGELGAVALQDAGLGLDRLGQRPEGRPVAIGEGPPLPPGEPRGSGGPGGQAVGQLGQQAALADAGVAEDGDQHRPGAVAGPAGGGQQRRQLAVAGHQGREAPAGGGRAGPGRERRPREHRVAAPRRGLAGRAVGDRPLGGPAGRLRHQHRPGRGQLLEPGRRPHGLAGDPPPGGRVASWPDQHLPGGHGRLDPHRPSVPGRHGGQGGPHGPLGVVVAGAGDAEQGDGAAAEGLGDDPAVGLDLGPDPAQRARQQPPGVLRVEVGEALAGLVDVDQQDGDELAFGTARGARWPGGAGHSPLLPRDSYGSCVRPSLAPPGTRD